MPWRIAAERVEQEAAGELATLLAPALRTLVAYGARHPPIDGGARAIALAAVVEPLAFEHLQRTAQWYARWRRHGVTTPLMLSASDLERSRDVFPLELLEIKVDHRTLAGSEMFDALVLAPACLRAQCEREVKGRLVRLRALYLEAAGSTRDLQALVRDSRRTFVAVMRGLLCLRGEAWIADAAAVVRAFERHHACRLPLLAAGEPAARPEVERHFAAYLAEIETLADIADRAERER